MYVWKIFCTFLINYHGLGCLEYDLAIFGPIFVCLLWMPEKRHHERMSTRNSLEKEGSHCLCSNKSDSTPECILCFHCIQVIAFELTFTMVFYNIFMVILHIFLKKRRKRKEILSTSPFANYRIRYKNHSYMND